MNEPLSALLLADFNLSNFADLLTYDVVPPQVSVVQAPYGQVQAVLLDEGHDAWKNNPDVALIWTSPQAASPSWAARRAGGHVALDSHLAEVDSYCKLIESAHRRVRFTFVPTFSLAPEFGMGGPLDLHGEEGDAYALAAMNLRLMERLSSLAGVYPLNTQRWIEAAGPRACHPKLWYMAKTPFGPVVFQGAVADVKSALNGLTGRARKLIVLDLDNTLWGGIVGDVGWQNIALGGHDAEGEAFVDFQRALKSLQRRGVLLAIVSKNEEAVALEAIEGHPEMVLRRSDFCGWRINWKDKAANVDELVRELNLGLQSVVFIDDNPVERARVQEALPEVMVPEWPDDPMLYRHTLSNLRCFDTGRRTKEDIDRTAMYQAQQARSELKAQFASLDEWLRTLHTRVKVSPLNEADLVRAAQLLNKTNQFNLTTRRLSEQELTAWVAGGDRHVWTFRVTDKLGDSGLTGIASLDIEGDNAQIEDLVLSCRVMGRRIEETMLHVLLAFAAERGLKRLSAQYLPTAKNKPCLSFLESASARATADGHCFSWNAQDDYPLPLGIALE